MNLELSSISKARSDFLTIVEQLHKQGVINTKQANESLEELVATMIRFFDITEGVDKQRANFVANDITDIAEHGLSILAKLLFFTDKNQFFDEKQRLQQLSLVIANWAVEREGVINILEPIVDALAQLANTPSDSEQLIALAEFMGLIADASSDQIKQDIEATDMFRPWRILNINRGIVATRTNDPKIMRQVFADLIKALPLDAPVFFKEGMSEMVRLNYPQPVRDVMQEYFEQTDISKIH